MTELKEYRRVKMAYAYVLVTAGKILDLLPINVTDEPPKKKENTMNTPKEKKEERKSQKETASRLCTKCKEYKPGAEFYGKGYCKACVKTYNARRTYDKKRDKKENEGKELIRQDFFKKGT